MGSDLHVTANLKDGLFLWLETPNKDFTMHLGGWMQMDNVFWDQSTALKNTLKGKNAPAGTAGLYYRRARAASAICRTAHTSAASAPLLKAHSGKPANTGSSLPWKTIQYNTTGLDEFWVGEKDIPVIGTIRVGHVKDPVGLEGDMTASSRCMTFMERSGYSQAIELDQNFVTGVWMSNNYLDERATWSFSVFRPDVAAATGYSFGDDQWGWQGRLTALPIYDDDGQSLIAPGPLRRVAERDNQHSAATLSPAEHGYLGGPARNARRRSRQRRPPTATATTC